MQAWLDLSAGCLDGEMIKNLWMYYTADIVKTPGLTCLLGVWRGKWSWCRKYLYLRMYYTADIIKTPGVTKPFQFMQKNKLGSKLKTPDLRPQLPRKSVEYILVPKKFHSIMPQCLIEWQHPNEMERYPWHQVWWLDQPDQPNIPDIPDHPDHPALNPDQKECSKLWLFNKLTWWKWF